jgi:FSR family fosmidomycin resistance protein-like MFS transporter
MAAVSQSIGGQSAGYVRPRYARIAVLSLAHAVNDSYSQYLQILLPLLAVSIGFDLGRAGVIVTIYTITSAVIQPALGHIADRYATRMISVAGMCAMATGASLMGVAPNLVVLGLFTALAGLGTAAYHPQASAMIPALAGSRKASLMSIYLVAGSVGFALGPKIVGAVAHSSLHATPILVVPGLLMAGVLAIFAPRDWGAGAAHAADRPSLRAVLAEHRRVLALLLIVILLRSTAQQSFSTFLPFLYKRHGHGTGYAADVLTVFGLVGALGSLAGGFLAERMGQKRVIVATLILAGPLLVVLPKLGGTAVFVVAGLAGALLLSAWNVLAVKGQLLLSKNLGMASGLMLGFSIGSGGLAIIPLGAIADRAGIVPVLVACALLAPLAGLLAFGLPE